MRFAIAKMIDDPPVFADGGIDYRAVEVDPNENPLWVQYALNNKGIPQ